MESPYHLGICTSRFNVESINRLLRYVQVPCEAFMIKNFEGESIRGMESLLFINPIFNAEQEQVFFDYIDGGGTAMILIGADDLNYKESLHLLSKLGLKLEKIQQTKRLSIEYTEHYPKTNKRKTKDDITSNVPSIYSLLSAQDKTNKTILPLITSRILFSNFFFSVKVSYGQGCVIIMSATSLPVDRADMLEDLLSSNKSLKSVNTQITKAELKSRLPALIEEAFEVYEVIPLEIIRRKANITQGEIDHVELLFLIEELIREGKLIAKIRGDVLAK